MSKKLAIVLALAGIISVPSLAQVTTVYDYDSLGRLCRVRYGDMTTDYHMDAAGNRTQKVTISAESSGSRSACSNSDGTPVAAPSTNSTPVQTRDYWSVSSTATMQLNVADFASDPDGDSIIIQSATTNPNLIGPIRNLQIINSGEILSFNPGFKRGRTRFIDVVVADTQGANTSMRLEIEREEDDD